MSFEEDLREKHFKLVEEEETWKKIFRKAINRHINTGQSNTLDLEEINNLDTCNLPEDEEKSFEDWLENSSEETRCKLKKVLFSYYYREKWDGKPDLMLLMETPGKLKEEEDSRHEKAKNLVNFGFIDNLKIYREFFQRWLGDKDNLREEFTESFLEKLNSKLDYLENYERNLDNYFPEDSSEINTKHSCFFKDLYVTDTISYRIKGGDILVDMKKEGLNIFLEEIAHIKPEIIFVFGGKAWESITRLNERDSINLELVEKGKDDGNEMSEDDGITDVHGSSWKLDFSNKPDLEMELTDQELPKKVHIIPLAHMSRTKMYIKDSYFDYLEKGLESYDKLL
ncbi:MAG: hypothetical protein BTN85_2191 [Candidatus Methanohalarchaeum thermophilum]|uniref:Uracil-DNA glycosylase-like domain-containing protein n=1 Tax=Methanohalarchaeum thermophilum TaxID=1903181 RepID=A0A1Q6DRY1_METT1|nr:MAG: hypothetical protein BTN85_2191 [Candidatus Methanohalarchaeum thermophilum]